MNNADRFYSFAVRFYFVAVGLALLVAAVLVATGVAHADSGTNVSVAQVDGFYGRRYSITVDGPVSLLITNLLGVYTGATCTPITFGSTGPHHNVGIAGANCTAAGTVIVDTVVYPFHGCVDGVPQIDHLTIVADSERVVYDELIGSGNCEPLVTTSTSTTVPPVTTSSSTVPGRHCVAWRYGKGGAKTCIRWST